MPENENRPRRSENEALRRIKVRFTRYLMDKGYRDPNFIAHYWKVGLETAKKYMDDARSARLTKEEKEDLERLVEEKHLNPPEAVHEEYKVKTDAGFGSCFIATAAYGTPFAQEINILRIWRDHSLKKSAFGRGFIKTYYKNSPPIANFISKRKYLKTIVRTILTPFTKILKVYYRF